MSTTTTFDDPGLAATLRVMPAAQLDELPFGVIAFNDQCIITRYNRYESLAASFSPSDAIGHHVFIELSPCLNNYLVAGRFESCMEAGEPLDEELPYVLTFRMRPTRVRLRLISEPGAPDRFILVQRVVSAQS
jgi:photoactive yellow protein